MQSLAAEWRRRAALQWVSGGWLKRGSGLPLFAFVGLAWSKQQEKDALFAQIRVLHATKSSDTNTSDEKTYNLMSLELGKLIATGCNAAVYEAKMAANTDISDISVEDLESDFSTIEEDTFETKLNIVDEENYDASIAEEGLDSDISIIDEEGFESDFSMADEGALESQSGDVDQGMLESRISGFDEGEFHSDITIIDEGELEFDIIVIDEEDLETNISTEDKEGLQFDIKLGGNCFDENQEQANDLELPVEGEFGLAVKMMFNYDVESCAEAVLRAMNKEALPIHLEADKPLPDIWQNGNHVKKKAWRPHPNIVCMYGVFVDQVPDLPDNTNHYPAALPSRLHAEGFGRNMTMFLVMKRYDCTLTEYLAREEATVRTRSLLFCQLLEAVAYLVQQGVAHRDIKGDNLLLDLSHDLPLLVISDFGCSLSEGSLRVPYVTSEINKGGNAALMAPEIACAEVGWRAVLDYSKSDLWAAGALAYEIMGTHNPFYRSSSRPRLDSRTYTESDLPSLPDSIPDVIQRLTKNILCRNPSKRVGAGTAATVMQLYLWGAPVDSGVKAVQDWTVSMAAAVSIATAAGQSDRHRNISNTLKQVFLSRISYQDLENAVTFMQTT